MWKERKHVCCKNLYLNGLDSFCNLLQSDIAFEVQVNLSIGSTHKLLSE